MAKIGRVSDEELERLRLEAEDNQLDNIDFESCDLLKLVVELQQRRAADVKI